MKKTLLILAMALISHSSFAANNLCQNLSGTWSGTYNDPTHLFPSGNFPISLELRYQNQMIYGYILPANDSKGGSFGASTGNYFFIAKCSHNTLNNIYFVKNQSAVCGDPATTTVALTQKHIINNLILPYENAMINANLRANLTQQPTASTMDTNLLSQIKTLAHGNIQTCH